MVVEMQNSGGKYTSSPTCKQHMVLKAKSEPIWLRVVVLGISVYAGKGEVEKGERQRDKLGNGVLKFRWIASLACYVYSRCMKCSIRSFGDWAYFPSLLGLYQQAFSYLSNLL